MRSVHGDLFVHQWQQIGDEAAISEFVALRKESPLPKVILGDNADQECSFGARRRGDVPREGHVASERTEAQHELPDLREVSFHARDKNRDTNCVAGQTERTNEQGSSVTIYKQHQYC